MKTISYKKAITPTKIENPAAALAVLYCELESRSSLSFSAAELVPNNINKRNYERGGNIMNNVPMQYVAYYSSI